MPASQWVRLLALSDCPPAGQAKLVECNGHELAVYQLANPPRFVVIPNSCPHAGGNLAAGKIEGQHVTCPWHEWTFDLDSGGCLLSPQVILTKYETRLAEAFLWVQLPD